MENIDPDVIVEKVDGEIRVIVNDDAMSRFRLSPENFNRLTEMDGPSNGNNKRLAIDLLKSIEQLRQIIIGVTKAIFTVQTNFLDQGVMGLKPLTLRQVAEFAGVHESTVSRVIKNKHVKTPQGIYKLKFFFNSALKSDDGEMVSPTVVKAFIRETIETEAPVRPLSDQTISTQLLNNHGISIPRRTVAKWREELGILSSTKRRKQE